MTWSCVNLIKPHYIHTHTKMCVCVVVVVYFSWRTEIYMNLEENTTLSSCVGEK